MEIQTRDVRESTQERVIAEASRRFVQFGVRSVRMDDLAEELHISKRTIYELFRDKEDLLMTCVSRLIESRLRERQQILERAPNVIVGIVEVVSYASRIIRQSNPLLWQEIEQYHPAVHQLVRRVRTETEYSEIVDLIQRGIDQELFLASLDVDILARLLRAQLDVIANERVFPPETYDLVEVLHTIIINFIRGIATARGREVVEALVTGQSIQRST